MTMTILTLGAQRMAAAEADPEPGVAENIHLVRRRPPDGA